MKKYCPDLREEVSMDEKAELPGSNGQSTSVVLRGWHCIIAAVTLEYYTTLA
jgi:hypothetical protein